MLQKKHLSIISKLAYDYLNKYAGKPANLSQEDLIQAGVVRVLERLEEGEDLLDGERFTKRGVSVIGGVFSTELFRTPNSSSSLYRRPLHKQIQPDIYTGVTTDKESLIEPSKIFAPLSDIEKDVLGCRLQKYSYRLVGQMLEITPEKAEDITKEVLSDPKVRAAFVHQGKRFAEDLPKVHKAKNPKELTPEKASKVRKRLRLRRLGLCVACGGDPAPNRASCQECLDKAKKNRDARKACGMCVDCGKRQALENKSLCDKCDNRKSKSYKNKRVERANACPKCGGKPKDGCKMCQVCLDREKNWRKPRDVEKERARDKKRYRARVEKAKQKGLCTRCGKRKPNAGKSRCEHCLSKVRARANKQYKERLEKGICVACGKRTPWQKYPRCKKCQQVQIKAHENRSRK